ncbi:DUF308 domain-containing protein [Roseicyclus amphidinii]|uniref:DUF308 domain-containing protein n=1 Tax=Roseicyclus amphidinii TaxID=3034232 RepID=UPI0024E168C7|nr:DUF308 domain-containing protein [Roseicyclus sp. Amp-Y-6]
MTFETSAADPRRLSRWLWIAGLASILLGLAGIAFPFLVTLAAGLLFGAVLVALGVVQVLRGLLSGDVAARGPTLLFGAAALAGGAMLLLYPPEGVLTLTALIAAFFLVGGMTKLLGAWQLRDARMRALGLAPASGRGWLALSGALSLALGLLLLLGLPDVATWALGLLLGVDLLFLGMSEIALAMGVARAADDGVTA